MLSNTKEQEPKTEISEGRRASFDYIIKTFETEDKPDRDYRLLIARKGEYYWNGIQNLAYNYIRRDWVDLGDVVGARGYDSFQGDDDLPRHSNLYRPLGESVISAMTPSLPGLRYYPEDATNPDDILTAKSYTNIEELIATRNDALNLLRKAIYIRWTQDYVCCYNYRLADAKYGSIQEPQYGFQKQNRYDHNCPDCGADMGADLEQPNLDPGICPECQVQTMPDIEPYTVKIPIVKDTATTPKTTEILEIYGQTHVKIPLKAANIKECPYLILSCEQPWTRMLDIYPHLRGKIGPTNPTDDEFDRQAREPVLTPAYHEITGVTYKRCWLRPWAFNAIFDESEVAALKKEYPDGCCVSYVNDVFAEVYGEDMDAHWTISQPAAALKIIQSPLGYDQFDMQDTENEIFNLLVETLKNGIPITLVDPRVIDFGEYKQLDSKPGSMIPARIPAGFTSIDAGVKVLQTATWPQGADMLNQMVQQKSQFSSGALPSIIGQNTAKTLGQSEMDNSQAMGRLNLIWAEIVNFYLRIMEKAIPDFANGMLEDEKIVKKLGGGNFVNVWIRKADLTGKVGKVLAESSSEFPVSWIQKRNGIFQLLGLNNDVINSVIFHPNNVDFISKVLGLLELYVPGQDQRFKQLVEVAVLMASKPTPMIDPMTQMPVMDPMTQQPVMQPSVPINPDLDDNNIHIATCQEILNSEMGIELQQSNPDGYQNIMLHLKMHTEAVQQQMMMQAQQQAAAGVKPGEENNAAPPAAGV